MIPISPGRAESAAAAFGTIGSISASGNKKATKKKAVSVVLATAAVIVVMLIFYGVIPLSAALLVIVQLAMQLAQAAHGFLLGGVLLAYAAMYAVFTYIRTVLEYEEQDL